MPYPTALSRLGVAKNTMTTYSTGTSSANGTALSIGGTQITVAAVGSATSTAVIDIYDGPNSERVTASALVGNTFTVSALTKNHPNGVTIASVGTTGAMTDYIPFTGLSPFDEITLLDDKGVRGSRAVDYGYVEGPRVGRFEWGGDVFADSIGWPLFSILNDVTYSAGTPTVWTAAQKNSGSGQPTPLTYNDNNGIISRNYTGLVHDEIVFSANADGKLTYTTKAVGYVSAAVTAPTASYSALTPEPSWGITSTIGGAGNILVQDLSLTIKPASVDPINTLDGVQDPYAFFAAGVEVTGKLLFVYEDDTQINNYLNNSQPSLDFTFLRGSGATQEKVQFHMSQAAYRTGKPIRSKTWVEVETEFTAIANTSDAGASGGRAPIKATLNNALTNTGRYQ